MDYFRECLCRYWTGGLRKGSQIDIDIYDGKCMVSLDHFMLMDSGTYNCSFTPEIPVLAKLEGSHFDCSERVVSMDKAATVKHFETVIQYWCTKSTP